MAIKSFIKEVDIESEHDGFLFLKFNEEQGEKWIELSGDKDYPFIFETPEDIDEFCKVLKKYKKLLKQ